MRRIDQPVILARREHGRDQQQTVRAASREFVSPARKFRRRRRVAPVGWQIISADLFPPKVVRNPGHRQHQIIRRVFRVKVHEILEHG